MRNIFLLAAGLSCLLTISAQTAYTNSFDNLALQTYTTTGSSTTYTNVPPGFTLINDGWINNPGPTLSSPNKPFHIPGLTTTGWAVLYNPIENDTFLVSTSWLDTTGIYVDRWIITPPISNINPNSVFTWLAKSPDQNFPEGYEVYGTTNAAASSPQDFSVGDRLFAMPDGNAPGGGEKNVWTRRSVSIGAYANQTLRFAFREDSKDMFQIWVDDIAVITLPNTTDVALSSSVSKKYVLANVADTVEISLSNLGASTVSVVTLAYQIGNSSIDNEIFSFANDISYGESTTIKFSLPYSVSQPGLDTLKVWVVSVNGVTDEFSANDTAKCAVTIQASTPRRTLLFEQFVSANNGEGPDAQQKGLALQTDTIPVVVVNIHDQDSLKEANSSALLTDYKKDFATAMINRTYFADAGIVAAGRPFYNDHILAAHKDSVTPASVSILNTTFNPANRQLTFTLKADFVGEVRGDYRINAYLTEDQVGGILTYGGPGNDSTINGYNQWNNSYTIPWSPYYQEGAYSSAAGTYILPYPTYVHQNTLVYAFDGAFGAGGLIPSTDGTQGQSYQKTYSLIIPSERTGIYKFHPDNLYIVGFVAEYDTSLNNRRVLNAVQEKVTSNPEFVGVHEIVLNASNLLVYPNPSQGIFYLNFKDRSENYVVTVYDVFGKCVRTLDVATGSAIEALDLSLLTNGVYFLQITSGKQHFTEKVIVQKDRN